MKRTMIVGKTLFTLLLLCAALAMAHKSNKKVVSYTTISMASAESTATGEINISGVMDYGKVLGRIIIDASPSTHNGFGTTDTFRVALRTDIDAVSYLVDSTECDALPCTATVSDSAWTVMGERMYMDWYWNDTASVTPDSTFSTIVRILLKLIE